MHKIKKVYSYDARSYTGNSDIFRGSEFPIGKKVIVEITEVLPELSEKFNENASYPNYMVLRTEPYPMAGKMKRTLCLTKSRFTTMKSELGYDMRKWVGATLIMERVDYESGHVGFEITACIPSKLLSEEEEDVEYEEDEEDEEEGEKYDEKEEDDTPPRKPSLLKQTRAALKKPAAVNSVRKRKAR